MSSKSQTTISDNPHWMDEETLEWHRRTNAPHMDFLREMAEAADPSAILLLYEMADRAVTILDQLPSSFLTTQASQVELWPAMIGKNATALDKKYQERFAKIKLGTQVPARTTISRQKFEHKRTLLKEVASELFFYVSTLNTYLTHRRDFGDIVRGPDRGADRQGTCRIAIRASARVARHHRNRILDLLHCQHDPQLFMPRALVSSIASLPPVSKTTFKLWFGACSKVLVWLTENSFSLEKFGLRHWGETKHRVKGGKAGQESYYRDGILQAMEQALRRMLK